MNLSTENGFLASKLIDEGFQDPQIFIHCSGATSDAANHSFEAAMAGELCAAKRTLDYVNSHPSIKYIVYLSSMHLTYFEKEVVSTSKIRYAKLKNRVEEFFINADLKYAKLKIIRLPNIYGKPLNQHFGNSLFANQIILEAISKGTITITATSDEYIDLFPFKMLMELLSQKNLITYDLTTNISSRRRIGLIDFAYTVRDILLPYIGDVEIFSSQYDAQNDYINLIEGVNFSRDYFLKMERFEILGFLKST